MVRMPNPFRRGSRGSRGGQSGGTTPASSAAVSAGPSTPRKLSSHALDKDFATAAAASAPAAAAGGGGGSPNAKAAGGGGGDDTTAAADTTLDKRAAPWGTTQYDDAAAAAAAAAAGGGGEAVDRRHVAHYGLLSAQFAQAKQKEEYRQQHPPHQQHAPPPPSLAAPATPAAAAAAATPDVTVAAAAKTAAPKAALAAHEAGLDSGRSWEVFSGLDPGRFAALDQDGPGGSVLMPPGVSGGSLAAPAPPLVVSEIPAAPITMERPAPRNLPDFMDLPGEPRVTATPDKFHPNGHPLTPPEGSLTSLQQHFAFFDINKDGVISLGECITGRSGRVWGEVEEGVVHGSNSKAWDRSGHFTPARFEAMLSKYDRDGKGGLTLGELISFLRGQANLGDVAGMMASAGEWVMTWALLRDSTGVLRREDIRGMYDGTAFYRLAERNGYKHYGLQTGRAPAVLKGYA
ncbi:hypothetical protein PLESTF_000426300 [Pleodorina starrii]|nr:hypothetical protein PLESTF_000426300 [Pleodorina starrii]